MDILVRKARLRDLKVIDDFQHKLGAYQIPLDPEAKRKGRIRYLSHKKIGKMIRSRSVLVLIAEHDGVPIGLGLGERMRFTGDWARYKYKGHIYLLYVEPEFRNMGVGKLIMKSLLEWFRKLNLKVVRINVLHNNPEAIALYKIMGFDEHLMEMAYRP
jgi:ribosomal protein S18 acetylase RimI-like enzyme